MEDFTDRRANFDGLAILIDVCIFFLATWGMFRFVPEGPSIVGSQIFQFIANEPQWISLKFFVAAYLLAPIVFVCFYLFFSSTPGQLSRNLRTVDQFRSRLNPVSSFLRAFLLPMSVFPFCGLPFVLGLFRNDRRHLVDVLLDTNIISKKKRASMNSSRESDWISKGILIVFLGVIFFYVCQIFIFQSQAYKKGWLVGGTAEERIHWIQRQNNTKQASTSVESAEMLFEQLGYALRKEDKSMLLDLLTFSSQLLARSIKDDGDFFSALPGDIKFLREVKLSENTAKVFFLERHGEWLGSREFFMMVKQENGEWKIDLLAFLRQKKNNPYYEAIKPKNTKGR